MKQDDKYLLRFFFTFKEGWLFIIGVILGISLLGLIVTAFGIDMIIQVSRIIGGFIVFFFFIFFGMSIMNFMLKKSSLDKIKKLKQLKNPEVAVILGNDRWQGYFISSYLGIKYLLKFLDLKKQKYNVYLTPSKEEFNKLLNNKNIKIFYLVGHGSKRGFSLNKKEGLFYSDYQDSKIIKEEIHLYHCGHSGGKTLVDYLVKRENRKRCYVADKKEMVISYLIRFYDLYKKEKTIR